MATKVMLSVLRGRQRLTFSLNSSCFLGSSHNSVFKTNHLVTRNLSWVVSDKGIQKESEIEVTKNADQEQADVVDVVDPEQEALIQSKRDVSRLPLVMKNALYHSLKAPALTHSPKAPGQDEFEQYRERRLQRKSYAYFGKSSGIDPTVAWPSRDELEEITEFEHEWEPSLEDRMEKLRLEKEEEMQERRMLEERVEKAIAKMPEYIEQFTKRLGKQDLELQKQEEKRQALLEEARDYFGYDIDPRDPRFKEMQELKAEEELKKKKQQKKILKEQKQGTAMERLRASIEQKESLKKSAESTS